MLFKDNTLRWLETLLEERFGKRFEIVEQQSVLILRLPGNQGEITFTHLQKVFHQSRSDFPCQQWQVSSEGFTAPINDFLAAPSENELPAPLIEVTDAGATIRYDILGLVYWMLTRLEEVGRKDLDNHQRFPAISSHAFQHDYLERPIVDEWLIILGQVIQRVWPRLGLKGRRFNIKVSHDVDKPSQYAFKTWPTIGRMMAGHILKRHDFKAFLTAPFIKLATHSNLHKLDPFNTFDWLMDVSEANNLQSTFYFICGHHDREFDADYEPEHPVIRKLMRRIHERGHEIGLHPSYRTFQNPEMIRQEATRLKKICNEEGIYQENWGGRMHYLRWEQPTTLRAWESASIDYDATLGYADRPGFRCGTCHDYPAFDPINQEEMLLRIRPLVIMECTVISNTYMGAGSGEKAVEVFEKLKDRCQKVEGCYTLLWHNSYFFESDYFDIYKKLLAQ